MEAGMVMLPFYVGRRDASRSVYWKETRQKRENLTKLNREANELRAKRIDDIQAHTTDVRTKVKSLNLKQEGWYAREDSNL